MLNAKANEFMRLSDKEIQKKFNEYFQSTGLNAKPKDLWDSMGLNLEQKKKAEAHMKGLQKQINKKYMRPATSNKKKTGAKQAKNILPNDVKKEIRQFMVALLKQAFNQKSEEFRNYLLNNKGGFAEGAMELHDLGSAFADKLTEFGIVVDRGDTRAEIREKLIKKQAEIDVLESYIGDEKSFNELFQKYFNEDFDYRSTFDYICASSEFTTQDSSKKIEKFNSVLVLERGEKPTSEDLAALLVEQGYVVTIVNVSDSEQADLVPETVDDLRVYDQVVLNNVSNSDLLIPLKNRKFFC